MVDGTTAHGSTRPVVVAIAGTSAAIALVALMIAFAQTGRPTTEAFAVGVGALFVIAVVSVGSVTIEFRRYLHRAPRSIRSGELEHHGPTTAAADASKSEPGRDDGSGGLLVSRHRSDQRQGCPPKDADRHSSLDSSVYIAAGQRWNSNDDPSISILVEGSRANRWLVRTQDGDVIEMTGAHIRSSFHCASDPAFARAS